MAETTLGGMGGDKRWAQLRRLTEVSRALTNAVSLEEVLSLTVRRAAELFDSKRSVLMLSDEEGVLTVRAAHGLDAGDTERFHEPLQETLIARLQGILGHAESDAFLGVPLVVGGQVTGLLAVTRPASSDNVEEDEWLLSALADQAAVALEKTRADEGSLFRERLLGIVSHDLRNPIAAILMVAATMLKREDLDQRTLKSALRIQSSAERANRMIRDLLDFTQARLGAGIRIHPEAADVHTIVRQVVEELQLAHPERRIDVSHEGDGRGEWDTDRITQVVGNLIANAVQYSPPGSAVRVQTSGTDRETVTVTVHNLGPAIPDARIGQLFEPMQRASEDLSQANRSVGLGLYIVKHLVEAHRGRVRVRSVEGEGTTLTVRLPRTTPVSMLRLA